MATIAALAVIVFLLGLFFGLPYQQAYRRRLALLEQDARLRSQKKPGANALDKSLSSS